MAWNCLILFVLIVGACGCRRSPELIQSENSWRFSGNKHLLCRFPNKISLVHAFEWVFEPGVQFVWAISVPAAHYLYIGKPPSFSEANTKSYYCNSRFHRLFYSSKYFPLFNEIPLKSHRCVCVPVCVLVCAPLLFIKRPFSYINISVPQSPQ